MNDIDICLALYNGRNLVDKQIYSILNNQSKYNCRLNIVDDCSSDQSLEFVRSEFQPYVPSSLRLWSNLKNKGHVQTFSRAIAKSSYPYIMLSDQDDIWPIGRIDYLMSHLQNGKELLVVGNFKKCFYDSDLFQTQNFSIPSSPNTKARRISLFDYTFSRCPLFGCCFAFSSDLNKYILPIPSWVESHDRWIALIAILKNKAIFLDIPVTIRGIHTSNQTKSKRPFLDKFRSYAIKIISIPYLIVRVTRIDFLN